jgi:hypothetical protein
MDFIWTPIPFTELPIIVPAVLIALWFLLRSKTTVSSGSELDTMIGQGRPVVLEFFGNT